MTELEKKVLACVKRLSKGLALSASNYYNKSKMTEEISKEEFVNCLESLCAQNELVKVEESLGKLIVASYILPNESFGGFTLTMGDDEQAKVAMRIVKKELTYAPFWKENVKRKGRVISVDTGIYIGLIQEDKITSFCQEIARKHPDFSFEITSVQCVANSIPKERAFYEGYGKFADQKYEYRVKFSIPDVNEYGRISGRMSGTSITTNKIVNGVMWFPTEEILD